MQIGGKAYYPKSSEHAAALLMLDDADLVTLHVAGQVVYSRLGDLVITPSVDGNVMKVLFREGWLFEAEGGPELEAFLRRAGKLSWISRLEKSVPAFLLSTLLTLVITVAAIVYGIPLLSEQVARHLPQEVDRFVGQQVLESLDEQWFDDSALPPAERQTIRARFAGHLTVLKQSGEQFPHTPRLVFRRWHGGVNAFALSDGTIIVTDDMVQAMDTDAQLDSVLLHELGHVRHRHVMQALVRSSLLSVTVALLTGESSGVIDNLAGAGVFLFDSGFSREDEQEADQYAIEQMQRLYGSTAAMQQMFERLKQEGDGGLPEWLSTHPDIDSRIEAVGE